MEAGAVTGDTRDRSEWLALPAAWAAWVAFFVGFGLHGLNLLEDGYLLTLAERMLHGEIPYRDFAYIRPPLPILVQAALLKGVPGYTVAVARWYGAAQLMVVLTAAYALLGRLGPARPARALYAFLGALLACTGGFQPLPWYTVDGLFFSALAAWALAVAIERRRPGLAAAAGLAAGAATLCKQGFVVVALAGLGLTLTPPGRRIGPRPWVGVVSYALGGTVIAAATLGYLASHGALHAFMRSVAVDPRDITREVLGLGTWELFVGMHLPSLTGAVVGLAMLALIALPTGAFRLGLAAGGLAWLAASFWRSRSGGLVLLFFVLEPLYTTVWVGGLSLLLGRALGRAHLSPSAVWSLVSGLGVMYAASWSYVSVRAAAAGFALALPLVVCALTQWDPREQSEEAGRSRHFAAACLMLYAGLLSGLGHIPTRSQYTASFATERLRGLRSTPLRVRGVDGVVDLIRRETGAGHFILAFPDFPALYFLAERRNPTRVDWYVPQEVTRGEVQEALRDLAARPPRLVIVNGVESRRIHLNRRLRPVFAHVTERYEEREAIGEFLVFQLRRSAGAPWPGSPERPANLWRGASDPPGLAP